MNFCGWSCLLLLRIGISVMIKTTHVPDEYWQSLEVAYAQVFSKGTLTWEWTVGLRASFHAQMFSVLFMTLQVLGLDDAMTIWVLPRVFQGIICFLIDVGTYFVTLEYYRNRRVALIALELMVYSWFHAYIGCRTLINSFEAMIAVWTMYAYLRLKHSSGFFTPFIFLVGLGTAARITSIVLWLPLLPHAVFASSQRFVITLVIAALCVSLLLVTDYIFYGYWVFTPWEFIKFNFLQGHSALFGTHPFHWYFTQAMWVVLGVSYPLILYYPAVRSTPCLLWLLTMYFVFAFSFIQHKEFRFVYPVMPFAMSVSAFTLKNGMQPSMRKALLAFILIANFLAAIFFCGFHQQGTLAAFQYLRSHRCGKIESLDIVMGCHQTPGYSYLHGCVRDKITFIECPVELDPHTGQRKPTAHQVFGKYPTQFVNWIYDGDAISTLTDDPKGDILRAVQSVEPIPKSRVFPSHLLIYKDLWEAMSPFFMRHGYKAETMFYHSPVPLEESTSDTVVLLVREARQNPP